MATAVAAKNIKDLVFEWEGKDKNGKIVRGEMRAGGEAMVSASLRRQGILTTRVKKRRTSGGKSIKQKDIAIFTRQLATMMKAGVPLLQAFDIVARGATNPKLTRLLNDIRADVETGTSLSSAFRKHPLYFDALYCNLVEAGEHAGALAFGDREHGAVVLRSGDLQTRVDAVLNAAEFGVRLVQVLERNHRSVVRVDADHSSGSFHSGLHRANVLVGRSSSGVVTATLVPTARRAEIR